MNKALQQFGENVAKRRKAMGLTQEQLADEIGMDVRSVRAIEAGDRNPTFKTLFKISKALRAISSDLLPF